MMQVPDHLSVTGTDLMSIDPLNNIIRNFQDARNALLEKMSVPEHITVDGKAKTIVPPSHDRVYSNSMFKMEVPSHLNVFHLSDDTCQKQEFQIKQNVDPLVSSNIENPYEEAKLMKKRFVAVAERLKLLENEVQRHKRRECYLLIALIGAAITMTWNYIRH